MKGTVFREKKHNEGVSGWKESWGY